MYEYITVTLILLCVKTKISIRNHNLVFVPNLYASLWKIEYNHYPCSRLFIILYPFTVSNKFEDTKIFSGFNKTSYSSLF